MSELVELGRDDVPMTTSMRVADGTQGEHASVLRLIRDNLADFEEFGRVGFEIAPFETAGGVQRRTVAFLNEQQATLLLTYMRNTPVVRDFKKRLVRAFYVLRQSSQCSSDVVAKVDRRVLARMVIEAEDRADHEAALRQEAEQWANELVPAARNWVALASGAGSYLVADAATILSSALNIKMGQNRLFLYMQSLGWVYRRGRRWRAYQSQVECGRLINQMPKEPYWNDKLGQWCIGAPTVWVTAPKGVEDLLAKLGNFDIESIPEEEA